jgi:hypothetical protein
MIQGVNVGAPRLELETDVRPEGDAQVVVCTVIDNDFVANIEPNAYRS